jgi:hypothetical protein
MILFASDLALRLIIFVGVMSCIIGCNGRDGEPVRITAKNGRIATTPPAGSDWESTEAQRTGPDYVLTEIKWKRATPEGDVSLYAKEYATSSETLESICGRDWRAYYTSLLPIIDALDARRSRRAGRDACDVDAQGTSTRGERLRIKERYWVIPGYVLLLTAAGPTKWIDDMQREIESWFDSVRFEALPPIH